MQRIPPLPGGRSSRKEGAMDRSVDQGGGNGAVQSVAPAQDGGPADDGGSEDIESELYCSTREAGVGAISFGLVADV